MTRKEFEKQHLRRWGSGVSLEDLKRSGQFAIPCQCGEEGCQGWKMTDAFTEEGIEFLEDIVDIFQELRPFVESLKN